MSQSKKGRELILKNKFVTIENINIDFESCQEQFLDPMVLENTLLKYSTLAKLVCDQVLDSSTNFPAAKMTKIFKAFLEMINQFASNLKQGFIKEPVFVSQMIDLTIEVLGYMALKKQFKTEFVEQAELSSKQSLTESLKYLILISV